MFLEAAEGKKLASETFGFKEWKIKNGIHPILNYDTVIGNTGVSKKLVLFDISIITIASPEKIEWIELDKIFTHPNLSTEDKTIFADASCQESLKYWIDFYASQRPKEMQNN